MSENENEKMPTRGIRMPDELWKTCIEMSKELGYGYPSDFIRDAIEFFIEWNKRKSSEKFLTPALESVMNDYRYSDEELRQIRQMSIRRVMDTNGRLHLGEKGTEWQDLY